MTVKDLIEELQMENPDDEVMIGYPSGDYWRRTVACTVDTVEETIVTESAYHGNGLYVVPDEDDMDEEPDETDGKKSAVVLR